MRTSGAIHLCHQSSVWGIVTGAVHPLMRNMIHAINTRFVGHRFILVFLSDIQLKYGTKKGQVDLSYLFSNHWWTAAAAIQMAKLAESTTHRLSCLRKQKNATRKNKMLGKIPHKAPLV